MKRFFLALSFCLCALCCVFAAPAVSDSARVSFVICSPGSNVYELEGHAAMRVVLPDGRDLAVNYGIFDFDSPNFIYRFVKGETDYMVAAYPFSIFLESYVRDGREVVEYPIALDAGETSALLELLSRNLMPDKRVYRYNYVKDNCSTRLFGLVEDAVGDTVAMQAPGYTDGWSFRDAMRHYHRNYPWYQFGIDLALGSGIDYPISEHEKAFAPHLLIDMLPTARIAGQSLVADSPVRYAGRGTGGPQGPTPWPLTPMAVSLYILAGVILCAVADIRRRRVSRWVDIIFMSVAGLAGCLLAFLVFISVHEATSPNWLIVWLNPLCFIVPACVYIKKCVRLVLLYEIVNFVALFLLCMLWPFTGQSANEAFWPFIAADMILSARYIYIIYASCAKKQIQA
ncbi:lipoprotein N-acyltransferase Lnb domain-containing protein [Muribaculum intestinale]|uniref:lipoprotein N-acyltransferase Lnb domain-containing protein n=1 Tax=Muribaculum intestinale TaxID=1796646 RepID=UPI00272B102C|nr:DUF4105 domain-containing protein [Muribaculum intestinale]